MLEKQDITTLADIQTLVDEFYAIIRQDSLLGPIFEIKIKDRWPAHLEKMYTFWQTILLEEHTYSGSPFPPHAVMPLEAKHFERWKSLFIQVVDQYFAGETANQAKWRAEKMASIFQAKLNYLRQMEANTESLLP